MGGIWHDYLYYPLFNLLFFLYSGPAGGNLGVAIIELTVLLRLVLMPFTVLEERSRYRYERLALKIETIQRDFRNDAVLRKQKIRGLLRQHNVRYWSKSFVLGVQGLVLVLLYQVFVGGLRLSPGEELYAWVSVPTFVNTMFLGFDLAERNFVWPLLVAGLLFAQLYWSYRRNDNVTRSDIIFIILFPLFTFLILWILPMVKALFILTSMIFTLIVKAVRKSAFKAVPL